MVLLLLVILLVDINFNHCLTDLHFPKVIMRMLPIREASTFSGVNTAISCNFLLDLGTGKAHI